MGEKTLNTCPSCNAEVVAGKRWYSSCRANLADPQIGALSSPRKRLGAYVRDVILVGIVIFFSLFLLSGEPIGIGGGIRHGVRRDPLFTIDNDIVRIVFFLIFILPRWVEVLLLFASGTTPAKSRMGMYVIKTDGERAGFFTMLIRELVKCIVAIPIGLGLLWMIWDADRQGWHDKIMNTWVVVKSEDEVEESEEDDSANAPSIRLEDTDAYKQRRQQIES